MVKQQVLVDAMALLPRYDEHGNLYTVIVKASDFKNSIFRPTRVIDHQLRKNGSSLRGAKDAASYIMGSVSMHPFLMQTYPDLHVWFPSESPRNIMCVYFCLHQIVDFEEYLGRKDETIVYLQGKYAIVIPVPKNKFALRYNEANCFLGKAYCNRNFGYEPIRTEQKEILQCAEMHAPYLV